MQKTRIISLVTLFAIIAPFFGNIAKAATDVQTASMLSSQVMPWSDTITVSPGEEFKILLTAGNYSEVGVSANNVVITDSLPTFSTSSGSQNVDYVLGSSFYNYIRNSGWTGILDDGTSPFDGSGLPVSDDGILIYNEVVNYEYSVKVPDVLPAGINNFNWNGPLLSFEFNGTNWQVSNGHVNTITISNLPSITAFSFNKTSFTDQESIIVSATSNPGKQVSVRIGSVTINLTEGAAGQYSATYAIPAGTSLQNQQAVLYVLDGSGKGAYLNYGSGISIIPQGSNPPVNPPSGGGSSSYSSGGGSAGGVGTYVSKIGDAVEIKTNNGFTGRLVIESNQQNSIDVRVNEASFYEISNSPMPESFGKIIRNAVFSVRPGGDENSAFPSDATFYIIGNKDNFSGCETEKMRIAYYSETDGKWIAYASEIPLNEYYIYSSAYKYGLYSLVCYAGTDKGYEGEDENGVVEGASTGVYPNGTLLKQVGKDDVWYISGGKKYLVSNVAFQTRFNPKDIVVVPTSLQIDSYETAGNMSLQIGTIVKEQGKSEVYRVSVLGGLQQFDSYETYLARGYSNQNIVEVERDGLKDYNLEHFITNDGSIYSGDLVKSPSKSTVYYFEQGSLRPILSWSVFEKRMFNPSSIITSPEQKLSLYSLGDMINYPDGTLIKGSTSSVYVVSDGLRRPIRSAADFIGLLYDWNNIVRVSDEVLETIPVGKMLQIATE